MNMLRVSGQIQAPIKYAGCAGRRLLSLGIQSHVQLLPVFGAAALCCSLSYTAREEEENGIVRLLSCLVGCLSAERRGGLRERQKTSETDRKSAASATSPLHPRP